MRALVLTGAERSAVHYGAIFTVTYMFQPVQLFDICHGCG